MFPQSVDAIFAAAEERGMRLIAGKVLMDEHCPEGLRDNPQSAYDDSKALIGAWHGKGRLGYAITPRFALTSSPAQLEAAGQLAAEYSDTWLHTHPAFLFIYFKDCHKLSIHLGQLLKKRFDLFGSRTHLSA